jgi:hypothetical protein
MRCQGDLHVLPRCERGRFKEGALPVVRRGAMATMIVHGGGGMDSICMHHWK